MPERLLVDPVHPDPNALLRAAGIIRQGGLVAYPTETVYGLGVDPHDARAVDRLFAAKGRPTDRSVILLLSHTSQAFDVADTSSGMRVWFEKLARAFWPGPLTLVLPARASIRIPALAGAATVAVRVSSCPVAWQLVRTIGAPITSTSANPTGAAPAETADALDPALSARIDLVLDAGPAPGGPPSTVLDLTGYRPEVLREGRIPATAIASVLGVHPRMSRAA